VSSDGVKSGLVDSDWAFDDAARDDRRDLCDGKLPVHGWVVGWIADHATDIEEDLAQNYFEGDESPRVKRELAQTWIAGFARGLEQRITNAMRDWCES
jgi:hypothetical protein